MSPGAAMVSVKSMAPSGLTFTLADRGLRADLDGTPSLAGVYRVTLAFTQPGRVDEFSFAVDATCPAGHTQQPDRSCEAPVEAVCTQRLGSGTVNSGVLVGSGSWESGCVLPAGRRVRDLIYYAKHYTFNLQSDAGVTIDLASSVDTYLFLLRGHGPDGTEVDHDDDGGVGYNSRLSYRPLLEAGGYTVTASTFSAEQTGSFNLAVRAVAHATTNLQSSFNATVGQTRLVEFAFSPAGVAVPTIRPANPAGLDVSVSAVNYAELDGQPSLRFTARRAGVWNLGAPRPMSRQSTSVSWWSLRPATG